MSETSAIRIKWAITDEAQERIDNSPASPTATRPIRFRKLTGKLYVVKKAKTLVVGNFGTGYLEAGDGYIIVAGQKVLLTAEQIAALERGSDE